MARRGRGNNNRPYSCSHKIIVHHIAEPAFFGNVLMRCSFGNLAYTTFFYANMLMGMNQVLTRNKTDQQQPRMENMSFMRFQSSKRLF